MKSGSWQNLRIMTLQLIWHIIEKTGTIRFGANETVIKTSIMLNPLFLGKGLGSHVIKLGVERFVMEKKPVMQMIVEIKKEDVVSIKAFEKAGLVESCLTYFFKSVND